MGLQWMVQDWSQMAISRQESYRNTGGQPGRPVVSANLQNRLLGCLYPEDRGGGETPIQVQDASL